MKKIIIAVVLFFAACTKTNAPWEHQEGQHFEIWAVSKVRTTRPGSWCRDSIYKHEIDTLFWNTEHPDTRWMLNTAKLDSTVGEFIFYTVYDSLRTEGTTFGPL